MQNYNKLIAAVVGLLAVVLGPGLIGISDGEMIMGMSQEAATQTIIMVLTAAGVWAAPNKSNGG